MSYLGPCVKKSILLFLQRLTKQESAADHTYSKDKMAYQCIPANAKWILYWHHSYRALWICSAYAPGVFHSAYADHTQQTGYE